MGVYSLETFLKTEVVDGFKLVSIVTEIGKFER